MKLNPLFVKYLFFRDRAGLPEDIQTAFKNFDELMENCPGDDYERRTMAAILIMHSDLEGDEVAGLTEDVLSTLKAHKNEFSAGNWNMDQAFACIIQKLGCADAAFKAMAEVAVGPATAFKGLLDELEKLGVKMPTKEEWKALKPPKKEPKPKKGGKK